MSRIPLYVTAEQHANLQKLADYLLRPEPTAMRFTMSFFAYTREHDEVDPVDHTCGAAGCAVGHGPAAGIVPTEDDDSWMEYAYRVFGIDIDRTGGACGDLWDWCFDSDWSRIDNSPRGAGRRIQIALTEGVPFNHLLQRRGEARLEYAP